MQSLAGDGAPLQPAGQDDARVRAEVFRARRVMRHRSVGRADGLCSGARFGYDRAPPGQPDSRRPDDATTRRDRHAIQVGLLGVFAILYHKEPSVGVFVPLTAAALAFALLWLRVQVRHWRYCVHVHAQMRRAVPDYARTVAAFAGPGRTDGLSIGRPLALAVPLLFAATWVALFAWLVARPSG